ncbi:MAG: glycoside hydrolase family 43 protein, partial [Lachnospiraceae bacterium]|nr:glycoside hydrolase family 43 protein [Lachnospiraceae bacterium]
MAPGHNSVLKNRENDHFLVCHIREKNFTPAPEPSTMQVRRLFFSEDGWPYTEGEIYAGKEPHNFSPEELYGFYERIDLVPMLPQGISTATPMKLGENAYYEHCSICGTWEMTGENRIKIAYGPYEETATVTMIFDRQRKKETVALCGVRKDGTAFWAKKREDL